MGDVVSLKPKRGTARDQLLAMVQHQAQVQGKSVAQYLRELQAQAERNGQEREVPQAVAPRVPRDKYTYLTQREVDVFFAQITELRDRALFGTMYYFGLRASEVGLLLREYVNFRTRRIYVPRLKNGVPGEKVMTSDCRRLLQSYLQSRRDALSYLFPSRNARPISRKRIDALFRHTPPKQGCRHTSGTPTACATPSPPISLTRASPWSTCRIISGIGRSNRRGCTPKYQMPSAHE